MQQANFLEATLFSTEADLKDVFQTQLVSVLTPNSIPHLPFSGLTVFLLSLVKNAFSWEEGAVELKVILSVHDQKLIFFFKVKTFGAQVFTFKAICWHCVLSLRLPPWAHV